MKSKKVNLLLVLMVLVWSAIAQNAPATTQAVQAKKVWAVKQGDKAYNLFDFKTAAEFYKVALKKGKGDTAYIIKQLANTYRLLNEPANAEYWYSREIALPGAATQSKFWYAEMLRANMKYNEAKTYYLQYKEANPNDKNVDEILKGLENIRELQKDRGAYKINNIAINSAQSDFGPAWYKTGEIFFTSNRKGRLHSNVSDSWDRNNFYQIYVASSDSNANALTKVKTAGSCKPNGKFHDGPVAFNAAKRELIFTRSNYKSSTAKTAKDKKTVMLKLYSMPFPLQKGEKAMPLNINNDEYSNAHPAFTHDGNTLYFTSDRLGGQGGTDLYMAIRDTATGMWSEPKNMGTEINTRFDEKFPYIAYDGTLYFSSNALGGLGGLDVYKTKWEDGKWSTPENLGTPINSNADDFTFIIDSANHFGFFSSNRSGGMGDDDIYQFLFDESKLDFKVRVKVIDAVTKKPLGEATVALECGKPAGENYLTAINGEKDLLIKGGKPCKVQALKNGYRPNATDISIKDKNKTVTIPLTPDVMKLQICVKEKESGEPLRDAAVSIIPAGKAAMNYGTGDNGCIEAVIPAGTYSISSPDFASIIDNISEADIDPAIGTLKRDYFIPREELIVNVPLSANCFTGVVTVTDLKTGIKQTVQPNTNGEVRLDIVSNNVYAIEHNGRIDTVSTVGLKPGTQIDGPCKFYVGQTWIVRNIYYDLNKWAIRPDAAKELNNLVRVMKENPTLEIELSSHTDCRSTQRYNLVLSARRAKSAVEYIIKAGIKGKRILAAGYGETAIMNGCVCEPTNDSPCNNDQHQANRRTEVKVLKY